MLKTLKRLIKRTRLFFVSRDSNYLLTEILNRYSVQFRKDSSSILLPQSGLEFRVAPQDRNYVSIGERCLVGVRFIFESQSGQVRIGNNVHIGMATFISRSQIVIGDDVTMAWDITLYDHNSHSIYWEDRKRDNNRCFEDYLKYGNNIMNKDWSNVKSKPITIGPKVWIGFGVTILKGVSIGEGAVIGARSVVTKDIPAWAVAAGNPAHVVKSAEK